MDFSVLMSVYYKEKPSFLDQALDSIINQTVIPNEIVLVKDGPISLQLEEVINKHKKTFKNFNVIEIEKNVGLGKALKIGLLKCKYKIVARMDSDDISISNRFESQIKYFNGKEHYDVVGSNIYEFEENISNILSVKKMPEQDNEIKEYSKFRNPINHPTVMFRKSSVLNAGNYKEFLLFEDYYLWERMIQRNNVFYNIQEPLLYFRRNSDTFYKRGGYGYLKNEIKLFSTFLNMGIINKRQYIKNIVYRLPIRLVPNFIRSKFYSKVLRENYNKAI